MGANNMIVSFGVCCASYTFSLSLVLNFFSGSALADAASSESIVLRGHKGPVYALRFLPEGTGMLSASEDCTGNFMQLLRNGVFEK